MPQTDRLLGCYLHLARASKVRSRPIVRDKILILAGVLAAEMGLGEIANLCRYEVLFHNPQHLVGNWPTMHEALEDERFCGYVRQLRRRYSTERAEHMLTSLGVELGNERELYYTDHEYAAALMGLRPEQVTQKLRTDPIVQGLRSQQQLFASSTKHLPQDLRGLEREGLLLDGVLPGVSAVWSARILLVVGMVMIALLIWLLRSLS